MKKPYNYRVITEGLGFPEGPVVLPDGNIIVCEIEARQITKVFADGCKETLVKLDGAPNGAAIGKDGALYICNNGDGFAWGTPGGWTRPVGPNAAYTGGRIERVDLTTGEVTEIFRTIDGHDLRMPNDIVVDREGGLWFTDHGRRSPRGILHGGLYYGSPDGSFSCEVSFPISTANGVGLSPDEETVYVAETDTGRLHAFDIIAPGKVEPRDINTPGKNVLAQLEGYRRYDSLAVEECGNICVAGLAPGCITVISPNGSEVETIEMPDLMSTNIAFGGPDMKTAYITLSGGGRLIAMDWPRSGLKPNFSGL